MGTPPRSSLLSGACSAGAARSIAPSRFTRGCASTVAQRSRTRRRSPWRSTTRVPAPWIAPRAAPHALALDYQSAGLRDRAERVLEELAASREYRRAALDHLEGIYEAQGDWA